MGTNDEAAKKGLAASFGLPPRNAAVFAVTTQICGAVMMIALGLFCLWASTSLQQSHARWVVRIFARLGIPAERRPEMWFLAGVLHAAWSAVCLAMSVVAGRAVKKHAAVPLRWVAAGHTLSTVVVLAWGIAMANFVRWPLLLVGFLWIWTIWGYMSIVQSWSAPTPGTSTS